MDAVPDDGSSPRLPPRPTPRVPLAERAEVWLGWFGLGRLLAVAASVLAIGAGGFWLLRAPPPPVEASLPRAASAPTTVAAAGSATAEAATTTTAVEMPETIVVHVAGAVVVPGVYQLPAGARAVDAVSVAGGASADALADALNLAQPLHDGDRVYVPRVDEAAPVPIGVTSAAPATGEGASPLGPVDVNRATADELDALPGVGPSTAAAIVAHRDQNGPFASVDALADVRGIGPVKLESLRGLVTV